MLMDLIVQFVVFFNVMKFFVGDFLFLVYQFSYYVVFEGYGVCFCYFDSNCGFLIGLMEMMSCNKVIVDCLIIRDYLLCIGWVKNVLYVVFYKKLKWFFMFVQIIFFECSFLIDDK